MLRTTKTLSPVDRAAQELEQKIRSLENQIQQLDSPGTIPSPHPPAKRLASYFKDILTPPTAKSAGYARPRHDLFDLPSEPLKELAVAPVSLKTQAESDLFASAASPVVVQDRKLAEFLSVGSFKNYHPLKHEQRANRKRFYVWLGLAVAALCILWVVGR